MCPPDRRSMSASPNWAPPSCIGFWPATPSRSCGSEFPKHAGFPIWRSMSISRRAGAARRLWAGSWPKPPNPTHTAPCRRSRRSDWQRQRNFLSIWLSGLLSCAPCSARSSKTCAQRSNPTWPAASRFFLPPAGTAASLEPRRGALIRNPEQPPRVLAPDLHPIILADRAGVEPIGGVVDVLERPVGREHDAVGADFQHGVVERRRVEIARRGDVEIFAEVLAQPLFCRPAVPVLDPGIGIVDPPHRERQVLAHMAEDDLQARMGVEQA